MSFHQPSSLSLCSCQTECHCVCTSPSLLSFQPSVPSRPSAPGPHSAEKEMKAQRKPATPPGPYNWCALITQLTQHSCQLGRPPGLTVLLKLASCCAWDGKSSVFSPFSDRPLPLPWELPEEVAVAFWMCVGQGGKSVFFGERKSFCVHFICRKKNGSSEQPWAKLFYEWDP